MMTAGTTDTTARNKIVYIRLTETEWKNFRLKLITKNTTAQSLLRDYILKYTSTDCIDNSQIVL